MTCIKPKKCFYWAWDDICLTQCKPCKNPYRCQDVVRYPAYMNQEDVSDIVHVDFMQIHCPIMKCAACKNTVVCNMYLLAIRMIERGDY